MYRFSKLLIATLLICLFPFLASSQVVITCGQTITRTNSLTVPEDLIVPVDAGSITVNLRGADGGGVRFSGLVCNTTVQGGAGATVNATFEVGLAPGQIPPGARLRTFVGEVGRTRDEPCGSLDGIM